MKPYTLRNAMTDKVVATFRGDFTSLKQYVRELGYVWLVVRDREVAVLPAQKTKPNHS